MPGVALAETYDSMPLSEKHNVVTKMAAILKALQDHKLPSSIDRHGGVTFDDEGQIVSAAMASVDRGPWPSHEHYYRDRLIRALHQADSNPYIKGWHVHGVRERLDAFVEDGLPDHFKELGFRDAMSIVHADFTPENLLYDSSTQRITALIDFDFACVLHPSHEFLRSFSGAGGQFPGWSDIESSEQAALRDAKLHGFPSTRPEPIANDEQWDVAEIWEAELERLDVLRPRTIEGFEKVADVETALNSILPWRITNSDVLRMQSDSVILKCRADNEAQLIKLLDHVGY